MRRSLLCAVLSVGLAVPALSPAVAQTSASPAAQKHLVFFDWDKAVLTAEGRRAVAAAAEDYKRTGAARLSVSGYTDTSGSEAYNLALSERRAQAVGRELVRLGVPASAISTVGRGETNLLKPTADGVREAQNRRVEIELPRPAVAAPPPPPPVVAAPVVPVAAPPPPPLNASVAIGPFYGYNIDEDDRDNSSHLVGIEARAQYVVLPFMTLSLEQAGFNTVGTSSDDGWGGRTAVGAHFRGNYGSIHPYIGPKFGGVYGKGVQDSVFAGPEVGLEFDVTRELFVYARAAYDVVFRNDIDEGILNAGLGAGYRF